MPIQAWIDDSCGGDGKHKRFTTLTLAGWIAEAEAWAGFSDDWSRCLKSEPRIKFFKAKEAAFRTGQFEGISPEYVKKKLRDLTAIIRKCAPTGYYYTIDMQSFNESLGRIYSSPFCDPYFWAYQQTTLGLGLDFADRGEVGADIFYDEQLSFAEDAKLWYHRIRLNLEEERLRQALPSDIAFKDDRGFMPLQAADLLAWMINRTLHRPNDNPLFWLWEEELLPDLDYSKYCQVVDQDRLRSIFQQALDTR